MPTSDRGAQRKNHPGICVCFCLPPASPFPSALNSRLATCHLPMPSRLLPFSFSFFSFSFFLFLSLSFSFPILFLPFVSLPIILPFLLSYPSFPFPLSFLSFPSPLSFLSLPFHLSIFLFLCLPLSSPFPSFPFPSYFIIYKDFLHCTHEEDAAEPSSKEQPCCSTALSPCQPAQKVSSGISDPTPGCFSGFAASPSGLRPGKSTDDGLASAVCASQGARDNAVSLGPRVHLSCLQKQKSRDQTVFRENT